MRFGSLFSGVGGFDLGLERAGMSCAWQVEADPRCLQLLARRWPEVMRYDDVRTVGPDLAAVDLVCGGFPCQDLSVAGKRAGLDGERSGLWFEFRRIIECAAPRWVLIENVPGLLSSNEGRDFGVLLTGLVELGYGVAWRILDAQFAGLAQRRDRVFIVGSLGDGAACEILFEPESVRWNPPPRRAPRQRVAPTLEARTTGGGGGWGSDFINNGGVATSDEVSNALRCEEGQSAFRGDGNDNVIAVNMRGREGGAMPEVDADGLASVRSASGGSTRTMVAPAVTSKWAKGNGGPAGDEVQNLVADIADPVKVREWDASNNQGRPHNVVQGLSENQRAEVRLTDTSRQLTTGGGKPGQGYPAALTPMGVRRLTPRECERLQGFPDDWTDGQSDSTRYRQLGNAVAVPVAHWIAKRIVQQHVPSGEDRG